jgi:hypothetical protein
MAASVAAQINLIAPEYGAHIKAVTPMTSMFTFPCSTRAGYLTTRVRGAGKNTLTLNEVWGLTFLLAFFGWIIASMAIADLFWLIIGLFKSK